MTQIPIQLGGLPIQLICIMNGQIAFVRQHNFKPIVEYFEDGLLIISEDCVTISNTNYEYNTAINYKQDSKLVKWLQSFKLELPKFNNPFGF